jgi:hypothetical protein
VSSIGTLIVLGAGLLAGVGGGITTTMYNRDKRAKKLEEQKQQTPAPLPPIDPAPYPVPSNPQDPATPPPLPPPVARVGPDGEPSIEAMMEARWWLLANEVQLKQDLALGAGPAIDDLAGLAHIAPARRTYFARLLQKNRALLHTPRELTPQQAARVMSRVGELVLADPVLRADGEAALAAR